MDARFPAFHPNPAKQGIRIEKTKYDLMRDAILDVLTVRGPTTFMKLNMAVEEKLKGSFEGSIPWYFVTVKLDLEARGEIRRVPKSKPQMIEMV
jgi:hypothetical protein